MSTTANSSPKLVSNKTYQNIHQLCLSHTTVLNSHFQGLETVQQDAIPDIQTLFQSTKETIQVIQ